MPTSGNFSGKQEDRELLCSLIENQLNRNQVEAPPLPAVANQILMLAQDPNADMARLSRLIQQDQALAGKVLHMANSPAYPPQSPIVSLQQAMTWLGLALLAQLALAISLQKGVFTITCYGKAIGELWRHALATGLYGKEVARRLRLNVENAFLCGLLHTIGKPFLLHLMLTSKQFPRTPPSWILLDSLLQEWHIQAGTTLAEAWNLPPPVQEAIQLYPDHTFHQAVSPTKGTAITCLAGHLASWLFHPTSQAEENLRALPVVQALNFYPDDMTTLFYQRDKILHQMDVFLV